MELGDKKISLLYSFFFFRMVVVDSRVNVHLQFIDLVSELLRQASCGGLVVDALSIGDGPLS